MLERGTHPLPFFWKYVIRKGFKSFVLKVCESKGFAGAFLRKCVNLKSLARQAERLEQGGGQGIERHDSCGVGSKALAATGVFPLLSPIATELHAGSFRTPLPSSARRLRRKYVYHK